MIRGGAKQPFPKGIAQKAAAWDHLINRGILSPRQIAEATEYATAAMRRVK